MEEKVKAELEEITKMLQNDGGDCELVKIEGKTVYLRLKGACAGCPHAAMTLKNGVETILKANVDPEISVVGVQD
ncbi:MAG: NifU family protein [Kiritimatiellae bacterium]|nr:NifU family protein [Kiritimatiellia bacterium]